MNAPLCVYRWICLNSRIFGFLGIILCHSSYGYKPSLHGSQYGPNGFLTNGIVMPSPFTAHRSRIMELWGHHT